MNKQCYDVEGMYHPYPKNSWNTVGGELIDPTEQFYGKISPRVFEIILEDLDKQGRVVLSRIIKLLNKDMLYDEEGNKQESICKSLIGYQGYKYTIECTHEKLAELLNLRRPFVTKGLKNLKEHGLIIQKEGLIYINPFICNKNSIYSLNVVKAFNLSVKSLNTDNTRHQGLKDTTSNDQTKESYTTNTITDNDSKITIYNITININKE